MLEEQLQDEWDMIECLRIECLKAKRLTTSCLAQSRSFREMKDSGLFPDKDL